MSIKIDLQPGCHPTLDIHCYEVMAEVLDLTCRKTITIDCMDKGRRECRIFIVGDAARKLHAALGQAIDEQDAFSTEDSTDDQLPT